MKEKKLTPRQREIFDYISQMIKKAGIPPTIREIGKKFGISSTNGVRGILSSLVKKGYIKRKPLVSRGIELVKEVKSSLIPDDSSVSVPVLGRIAAGLPVLAVENIEGSITLDRGCAAAANAGPPAPGRASLAPATPEFRSRIVERKAPGFLIAGKVIGLLRRM